MPDSKHFDVPIHTTYLSIFRFVPNHSTNPESFRCLDCQASMKIYPTKAEMLKHFKDPNATHTYEFILKPKLSHNPFTLSHSGKAKSTLLNF